MKKNLFVMLALWLGGAAPAEAQHRGYYPAPTMIPPYPQGGHYGAPSFAPVAQPVGGFPGFHGQLQRPSNGLQPYPSAIVRTSAAAQPPATPPATTPTFPPPVALPIPSLPDSFFTPPGETIPSAPPVVTIPGPATDAQPFLPPLPKESDTPPESHPKADPDGPPVLREGPGDHPPVEVGSDEVFSPGCPVLIPGQPVVTQMIEDHPLSKGMTWFFSAEYFFWNTKDQTDVPSLTLPTGGTLNLGVDPDNDERSGVRAHLGRWLGGKFAIEGDYLVVAERSPKSTMIRQGSPVTQLPFFAGINQITRSTEYGSRFSQQELGLRYKAFGRPSWRVDFLAGARYLEMDENISLVTATAFRTAPVVLSDAIVRTTDRFAADSRFIGGQIGLDAEFELGWFFFQANAKIAGGNNRQRVTIGGDTSVTAPPAPLGNQFVPGLGALATPTNSGVYARDRFAYVPELSVFTGVRLHECVRLGLGYNFLYISDVVRPADQIDTNVMQGPPLSFLGLPFTTSNPAFAFSSTSYWAQGILARLEIRY